MTSKHNDPSVLPLDRPKRPRYSERTKRRTPRACDRCRVKKAKCDGRPNCCTCIKNDGVCTYSAPRGRDTRNYYSRVHQITEIALKALYSACKRADSFPGVLPKEDNEGTVTINAILEGLGLIESTIDEHGMPRKLLAKPEPTADPSSPQNGTSDTKDTPSPSASAHTSFEDTSMSSTDDLGLFTPKSSSRTMGHSDVYEDRSIDIQSSHHVLPQTAPFENLPLGMDILMDLGHNLHGQTDLATPFFASDLSFDINQGPLFLRHGGFV